MSTTATVELPDVAAMTADQKRRLLALLIKDELESRPIPMPIIVRLDDRELGIFRPKWEPPATSTPYPFTSEERDEIIRLARNPGPAYSFREWIALEESEADAKK